MQANRKTVEWKQHPDRDAQFQYIVNRVKTYRCGGQPVISIDTKKNETLGNMKILGQIYRPKGQPTHVSMHDFPDKELAIAIPTACMTDV